jgi:hypothetical protein
MGITETPYPGAKPKASDIIDSGTLSVTTIAVDHIIEVTPGHNIVFNNSPQNAGGAVFTDHLQEVTGGHGVAIAAGQAFHADHIAEATPSHRIILENIETGWQQATGNSVTGAVIAHGLGFFCMSAMQDTVITVCKRAGVYHVHIYNQVIFAGGGHVHINVNGVEVAGSTPNNAAGTEESIGDITLAVGDYIEISPAIASPDGQRVIAKFMNADGMWY